MTRKQIIAEGPELDSERHSKGVVGKTSGRRENLGSRHSNCHLLKNPSQGTRKVNKPLETHSRSETNAPNFNRHYSQSNPGVGYWTTPPKDKPTQRNNRPRFFRLSGQFIRGQLGGEPYALKGARTVRRGGYYTGSLPYKLETWPGGPRIPPPLRGGEDAITRENANN
jgi:hypothetical protein